MTDMEVTRHRPARLEDARGVLLRVVRGTVWITQEGCIADVILEAGDVFRIQHEGLTLVAPCAPSRDARVVLEPVPAARPGLAERLLRCWRAPGRTAPGMR